MEDVSGVGPSSGPPPSSEPNNSIDPNGFSAFLSNVQNDTNSKPGEAPQSFAQTTWGFDEAEAKKFVSTLANTIIAQIKHEDERAKETLEKLKQAEQGEDSD
jgi:hypothetical protein